MKVQAFFAAAVVLCGLALAGGARADTCYDAVADGTGSSREGAMRDGFEKALRAVDPGLAQGWRARNMKLGEAPGFAVRKLTSRCSVGGSGQVCRIETTVCR